jgi:hypothetical protein
MDSVKPLDKRRGWTAAQVGEHNRERFEDLISAGWDLVIVDEAHRLGGSTDQVARFKLGQGLSEAAPYFLMLSATPHQGKTDAFHRLVSLIDAQEFPDISSVTRERVQPHVIRTEKRRAIDADGKSAVQTPAHAACARSPGKSVTAVSSSSTRRSPNTSAKATTRPCGRSGATSAS